MGSGGSSIKLSFFLGDRFKLLNAPELELEYPTSENTGEL